MSHRRRRLAARLLAISLLAATLFTVDSLASPSPAEARCAGVNHPVTSTMNYNGYKRVSETPAGGTCNNNDLYTGVLKDERADGLCVVVQFEIPNQGWFLPQNGTSIVCGVGNTGRFEWNDTNDNHQSYQRFCVTTTDYIIVACGWGNSIEPGAKGLNHGF